MSELDSEKLIILPREGLPKLLDSEELQGYKVGEIPDATRRVSDIYFLSPDDVMPDSVAEWLRYRSLTEPAIAVDNEADRYRFKEVEEIKSRFLIDQSGRSLFIAVGNDNRRLYGSSWVHQLQGDAMDIRLTNAALDFVGKHKDTDDSVSVENTATFATREYAESYRKGLALKLGMFAINHYFKNNPDCLVIVGRYSSSDNFQTELIDGNVDVQARQRFEAIDQGLGWVVYGSLRPSLREIAAE